MPATIPDTDPTAATVILLLLQVPPDVPSVSVTVEPAQTLPGPDIATGLGLTVTVIEVGQMPPVAYVMVTVPAATPVTTPDDEPTVAIAVLVLVHRPPVTASDNAVVRPTQTEVVPVMGPGNG